MKHIKKISALYKIIVLVNYILLKKKINARAIDLFASYSILKNKLFIVKQITLIIYYNYLLSGK